jgi:hypothetical protein
MLTGVSELTAAAPLSRDVERGSAANARSNATATTGTALVRAKGELVRLISPLH